MGKTLRGTILSKELTDKSMDLAMALRVQISNGPVERTSAALLLAISDALEFLVESIPFGAEHGESKRS